MLLLVRLFGWCRRLLVRVGRLSRWLFGLLLGCLVGLRCGCGGLLLGAWFRLVFVMRLLGICLLMLRDWFYDC